MSGEGWSRRGLAAALAPAVLSACLTPEAIRQRRLISINLTDTGPVTPPAPDTGAQLETAFDQVMKRIWMMPTFEVHGIAGSEPTDLALVRRLSVGAVTSRDLTLPVLSRGRLGADGLLGVDILTGRRMSLDFLDNRFEISNSGYGMEVGSGTNSRIHNYTDPIQVAAAIREGQLVILDAQVADVRVAAFIDSGAQVTVGNHALRDAVVRTHPDFGPRLAPVPLISATGQTAIGEFAPLPVLRLGGMQIYDVMGIFAELHIFDLWKLSDRPAILIGVDVLRHFQVVTLDFYRKVVVFTPAPPGDQRVRLQSRPSPGG